MEMISKKHNVVVNTMGTFAPVCPGSRNCQALSVRVTLFERKTTHGKYWSGVPTR